jgi:hypothetical protein
MGDTGSSNLNQYDGAELMVLLLVRQLLQAAANFTAANAVANVDALYAAIPVEVL